ncbi:hypothetical protein AMECASPLE_036437 [Ameca splendens]|uniref:Uncharacterized protein n=1 Tax=Ameca splendens TaxID=208324 RepID=A0ABV1A307_9TELE
MWGTKGVGLRTTLENWDTLRTRTHQWELRDTRVEVRVLGQGHRCCPGFFRDLLDESLMRCCSNIGKPAPTGKIYNCSMFSLFVHVSHYGSLESQSLRNGATLT